MPITSKDIGYCIVDATAHPVKIALHKLKPGLNGLKPAKLMLAIVLEPKKQQHNNNHNHNHYNHNHNNNNNNNTTWYGNQFPVNRNILLDRANDIKLTKILNGQE